MYRILWNCRKFI